jgi:Na+-translocating membrane potential-generating system MpsC-like protein
LGAAQVQEFHRQLFSSSSDEMRQEIKRVTGRDVREAAAEVETATGTVVHAFTTGAMVQVFLLAKSAAADTGSEPELDRWANDTGQEMSLRGKNAEATSGTGN